LKDYLHVLKYALLYKDNISLMLSENVFYAIFSVPYLTLLIPLSYFSKIEKGYILNRFGTDVQEIEWSVSAFYDETLSQTLK